MPKDDFPRDELSDDLLKIIADCRPTAMDSLNGFVHDDIDTDLLMQKLVIYICDRDGRVLKHGQRLGERTQLSENQS